MANILPAHIVTAHLNNSSTTATDTVIVGLVTSCIILQRNKSQHVAAILLAPVTRISSNSVATNTGSN